MINIIGRYKVATGLAGVLALTIGLIAATTAPSTQPTSPSTHYLAKWGMNTQFLKQAEPVSKTHALEAVQTSFPGLSTSRPIVAELLLFSDSSMTGLGTPQPVWLFTWNQISYAGPQARSSTSAAPVIFHHMNEVVSVTTGKGLEIFSTP